MNVHQANESFNFDKLQLEMPVAMPGNSYFTSITMDGKPLYIETPQITTKQGFVKGIKKMTCDLLFSSAEAGFIQWTETLETTCHKLVYNKSGDWFRDKLEYDDIENAFSPSMKSYKSGKYQVCRCNVATNHHSGAPLAKVYDEAESLILHSELTEQTQVICIVEVKGIRFTTRSFQIEYELRQVMVLTVDTVFDKCLIKKTTNGAVAGTEPTQNICLPVPKYNSGDKTIGRKKRGKTTNVTQEQESDEESDEEPSENERNDDTSNTTSTDTITDTESHVTSQSSADSTLNQISDDKPPLPTTTPDDNKEVHNTVIHDTSIKANTYPQSLAINNENDTDNDGLEAVDMDAEFSMSNDMENNENTISIKRPNQVYHEIYKKAKARARDLKRQAIAAILEANSLKNTYMLDIDDYDSDSGDSTVSDFHDSDNGEEYYNSENN